MLINIIILHIMGISKPFTQAFLSIIRQLGVWILMFLEGMGLKWLIQPMF